MQLDVPTIDLSEFDFSRLAREYNAPSNHDRYEDADAWTPALQVDRLQYAILHFQVHGSIGDPGRFVRIQELLRQNHDQIKFDHRVSETLPWAYLVAERVHECGSFLYYDETTDRLATAIADRKFWDVTDREFEQDSKIKQFWISDEKGSLVPISGDQIANASNILKYEISYRNLCGGMYSSLLSVKRPFDKSYTPDRIKNAFFSGSTYANSSFLAVKGLSVETAIFVLAAAGLRWPIPNLTFNLARSEELLKAKEKLEAERKAYLSAVKGVADEALDRLTTIYDRDTINWAHGEATLKIQDAAESLTASMAKLNRRLLQRLSYRTFKDAIPVIAGELIDKGLRAALAKGVEIALQALCAELSKEVEMRRRPLATYGILLAKSLPNSIS